MRAYNQGCHVRVTVSERDIAAFKRAWPCSGLPERSVGFLFDARNGDLIDIWPSSVDGEAALALSYAAQNYAAAKLDNANLKR